MLFRSVLLACTSGDKEERVEGRVGGDCDDGADNDGDGLYDCDDDGCGGSPDCATDTGPTTDLDGDGWSEADGDCDDGDASVHPDAEEEWGDGVDQDCDGVADASGASCVADFTVTFPDATVVTIDGCASWSLDATFEYDPDDPPEVRSYVLDRKRHV